MNAYSNTSCPSSYGETLKMTIRYRAGPQPRLNRILMQRHKITNDIKVCIKYALGQKPEHESSTRTVFHMFHLDEKLTENQNNEGQMRRQLPRNGRGGDLLAFLCNLVQAFYLIMVY